MANPPRNWRMVRIAQVHLMVNLFRLLLLDSPLAHPRQPRPSSLKGKMIRYVWSDLAAWPSVRPGIHEVFELQFHKWWHVRKGYSTYIIGYWAPKTIVLCIQNEMGTQMQIKTVSENPSLTCLVLNCWTPSSSIYDVLPKPELTVWSNRMGNEHGWTCHSGSEMSGKLEARIPLPMSSETATLTRIPLSIVEFTDMCSIYDMLSFVEKPFSKYIRRPWAYDVISWSRFHYIKYTWGNISDMGCGSRETAYQHASHRLQEADDESEARGGMVFRAGDAQRFGMDPVGSSSTCMQVYAYTHLKAFSYSRYSSRLFNYTHRTLLRI